MEKFLIDFLESSESGIKQIDHENGPVITISRECGCSANRIAIKLSKILSGYTYESVTKQSNNWKWVNKEVIEKAAEELQISEDKIKSVFQQDAKLSLHKVQHAFSAEKMYDADDQEVIDTLTRVIYSLAEKGNSVIVGRAAHLIAENISAKLRIRLQAPLDWRINRIRQLSELTFSEAEIYVNEVDRQRELMAEHISGRRQSCNDYDIVFNYSTLSDDEIVDAILHVLRSKKII